MANPARRFTYSIRHLCIVVGIALLASVLAAAAPARVLAGPYLVEAQGFDTCQAPSSSQMTAWWDGSPYYFIGIYLGGVNAACQQPNLTPAWEAAARAQGWDFLPLWVGRQPTYPTCNSLQYSVYISLNTATAYAQGVQSAQSAAAAAAALGFGHGAVIWDDLETYNTSNSSCVTAAQDYVNGWDATLAGLGYRGSLYAATCGDDLLAFTAIAHVPYSVDAADWNGSPGVYNLECLPNIEWDVNQRVHQFNGGHNETYDGVTLSIDNDCADADLPGDNVWTSGC